MQITVFFIAYTKKSTTLSLRVLIICSVSGLKITLRLLSSSLGNSSFAYVISQIRNTNPQKKYWTMFFNQIAIHMQNF